MGSFRGWVLSSVLQSPCDLNRRLEWRAKDRVSSDTLELLLLASFPAGAAAFHSVGRSGFILGRHRGLGSSKEDQLLERFPSFPYRWLLCLFFFFPEFSCKGIGAFLGTARDSKPRKFLPSIWPGWKIADAAWAKGSASEGRRWRRLQEPLSQWSLSSKSNAAIM